MHTSGEIRQEKDQWLMHWEGYDHDVPAADVAALQAQHSVHMQAADLLNGALDWATAVALGYKPKLQGQTVQGQLMDGGVVTPAYDSYFVVAYFKGRTHFGEFRPSSDPAQSSPIFDSYRISTEVAGDGWAALVNDCFDARTWAKSMKADSRVVAGLRALVQSRLGPVVEVPVELVSPEFRLRAIQPIAA
jgi:hypothetical protein